MIWAILVVGLSSVSYTHLDVYKRQVVVCGFVGCDLRPFNPLINGLPRLLHLGAGGVGAWVAPVLAPAV